MIDIEQQYAKLAPRLTNWLLATGSAYADACDLVQNVFLKVWKMRDDLRDSEEALSGLVFTIARNLRKNWVRDNKRLSFTDEIPEDAAVASAPASMPSDRAWLRHRLREAFAQLPPVLAEAYTLFQVADLSIAEIARQTGVTENLVKVRIFRAKQKLQKLLADLKV